MDDASKERPLVEWLADGMPPQIASSQGENDSHNLPPVDLLVCDRNVSRDFLQFLSTAGDRGLYVHSVTFKTDGRQRRGGVQIEPLGEAFSIYLWGLK